MREEFITLYSLLLIYDKRINKICKNIMEIEDEEKSFHFIFFNGNCIYSWINDKGYDRPKGYKYKQLLKLCEDCKGCEERRLNEKISYFFRHFKRSKKK